MDMAVLKYRRQLTVNKSTIRRLEKSKVVPGETFDEAINRIMDELMVLKAPTGRN